MGLYRRIPLVFITLSMCFGIAVGHVLDVPLLPICIISFLSFLLFATSRNIWSIVTFCIAIFLLSLGHFEVKENQQYRIIQRLDSLDEQTVHYIGWVLDVYETAKGKKIRLKNINLEAQIPFNQSFIYDVYVRGIEGVNIGDTLSGIGEWLALEEKRNPGDFDFRMFYHRKNILGKIFQDKYGIPVVDSLSGISILRIIKNVRNDLNETFTAYIGKPYAGLMSALITGERSEVDPEIKEHFIATGVVHVLAVSGLHVGYVLLILMFATKLLRIPWGWDRLVIGIGLVLFCLITGGKSSVIRASLMAMLYLLAPVLNRPANIWNIIAASAFCLLMWNPYYLFDMGFQLSFTAVISIVFFYNYFNRVLPERFQVSKISNKMIKFFLGLFLVSLSAQIGTLPFTAVYFGKIPIIALIANIAIVPLIGILVCIGFVITLFGWIPYVGVVFGQAAYFFGKIIDVLAANFAAVDYGVVQTGYVPFHLLWVYGLCVIGFILIMDTSFRGKGFISILIGINLYLWFPLFQKPAIDVIFLDVGQGDAALIRFQNGRTMLIDAGQRNRYQDSGSEMIMPVLNYFNIKKLDWAVMSHPHSDHIGGFISVLESVKVDSIWDTHLEYGTWTYNYILELTNEKEIGYRKVKRGNTISIDRNSWVQILAPDTSFIQQETNVNNASIVMKIMHGQNSFLFNGDLEHEGDDFLLAFGSGLKADVLKVGHHGSITSTTKAFLNLVDPDWAVVSVGEKNKFSHPSPVVMKRLKECVSEIRRTDMHQAVWLKSDGEKIWEAEWK